jgi:hypothetical protein
MQDADVHELLRAWAAVIQDVAPERGGDPAVLDGAIRLNRLAALASCGLEFGAGAESFAMVLESLAAEPDRRGDSHG